MVGFTETTPVAALAGLGPPVMVDAGSGLLDETTPWLPHRPAWLHDEPGVRQAIDAGAAIVTFSGDKLLGGPQAGIVVGRADLRCRDRAAPPRTCDARRQDHPRRAPDRRRSPTSPATRRRSRSGAWRRCRSTTLRDRAAARRRRGRRGKVVDTEAVAGGGSLPGLDDPVGRASRSTPATPTTLRRGCGEHGVIARVADGVVVCDLRTVEPERRRHAGRRAARGIGPRRRVRVVATAGHVDHGKSSLVLALTGTDPDRFAEEKARGLTIDLGFAFTDLPSGRTVGFVDVPGHERFVKNMLAGVGAVDVALFVVAANEGWMPQSEEHLRILDVLGVRHGIVALTKADTVERRRRSTRPGTPWSSTWRARRYGTPRWWCATRSPGAGSTTCDAPSMPPSPPPPRQRISVGLGSGSIGSSRRAAPARW